MKKAKRKTALKKKSTSRRSIQQGVKKVAKKGVLPLGDRILLKPLSEEELSRKSVSGIIIPETVDKEKPAQGMVVAVGEGRRDESGSLVPMQVKVGDRVVFEEWSKKEIKHNDEEYYIVSEGSVLAIIN